MNSILFKKSYKKYLTSKRKCDIDKINAKKIH